MAHDHHHGHAHDHGDTSRRALAAALALISGLLVAEVIAGLAAGSLALLADAGHMLTDVLALALALAAATVARRPAEGRWTFGFGRVTAGMDVVDRISTVPRDGNDRPREPVAIDRVELG